MGVGVSRSPIAENCGAAIPRPAIFRFPPGGYIGMRVGMDIGSTTIKCVVLDDAGKILFSTYERHYSHILEKGKALLEKVAAEYLPDGRAYLAIFSSSSPPRSMWLLVFIHAGGDHGLI